MTTITTPITEKAIKEHRASKGVRQLSEGAFVYRYGSTNRDKGSFHLRHYQGNRERWKLVGRTPDINLKQARKNFSIMKANLYLDPQDATPSDTFATIGQVLNWYAERVTRQNTLSHARIGAIHSSIRAQIIPRLGADFPLSGLTHQALDDSLIAPMLDDGSRGYARGAFGVLRQALSAAHKLHLFKVNPMQGMRFDDFVTAPERPKEPGISTSGFEELRNSLPPRGHARHLIQLMTMWGTRIGETLRMRWDWIDHSAKVMRIPAHITKTGDALDIPLTKQAYQVLVGIQMMIGPTPFIFPGRKSFYDRSTMNKTIKAISRGEWKSHDLRKLMRSKLGELGVEHWVAERLINHKITGLDAVYVHSDIEDRKREALTKYHDWLQEIGWFETIPRSTTPHESDTANQDAT